MKETAAKLISSNDKDNFTYRGRFATKEEAFAIGNETSQKVHNALKWIIRRQGGTYDTMVFVTWETAEDSAGKLEVRWDSDTEHIISEFDEWDTGLEDPEFDTNAIGAELFQKAMSGYRTLQNEEKCPTTMKYMVLLGVDAATPGAWQSWKQKKLKKRGIQRISENGTRTAGGVMKNGETEKELFIMAWLE